MTIFVRSTASGANNGTSWTNAFTSLQSALTAAASGDEIWVAAGIYKPTATVDRTMSFALKNGVGVYGGFAGTETMRSQRNPVANLTTLSGEIGVVGDATDNSYHVVTSDSTVTSTGVLDGFTVTAGSADGATDPTDRGGGAYVNGGSPIFSRVVFTANHAGNRGGGVRVAAGSPSFTNCAFRGNTSISAGGGLSAASVPSLQIRSCVFRDNFVNNSTGGGGIEATDNTTITNSEIAQNYPNGADLLGSNNTFVNSTVDWNGVYGVYFQGTGNVIVNSIVWNVYLGAIATLSVTYSSVPGGFAGTGNNDTYPTYVDPPNDLRLAAGSTGIDAGNNAAVPGGITTDVAGLPRFFDDPGTPNSGAGAPPIVDMGAFERVPLAITPPSSKTVCEGSSVSFAVTASGSAPFSYRWRKDGVNLSDGGSISGSATDFLTIDPVATGDAGTYDVVVTDTFGQSASSVTATLAVKAIPPSPVATNSGPVCTGESLQLFASTVPDALYIWNGPGNYVSIEQNPTIDFAHASDSGTYSVRAVVSECFSAPGTTNVVVNPSPLVQITAPSFVCPGSGGHTASVPDVGPGASYSWQITNGTIRDGAGTRMVTFTAGASGSVTFFVVVETGAGCPGATSTSVTITCPSSFYTLVPCRAVDTRDPVGAYGGPPLSAGKGRTFIMYDRCGIPGTAKSVSLNVTVTQTGAPGHVVLYPSGALVQPVASVINFRAGQTRASNAIVQLGSDGGLTVVSAAPTHLIIDVSGYFE
jgi:hypothetical protein